MANSADGVSVHMLAENNQYDLWAGSRDRRL